MLTSEEYGSPDGAPTHLEIEHSKNDQAEVHGCSYDPEDHGGLRQAVPTGVHPADLHRLKVVVCCPPHESAQCKTSADVDQQRDNS